MKTTQGIKLIPKENPEVSFLADKDMLEAYQERIKSYSERARGLLNIFRFKNGVIEGSNSFANVELASSVLASPSQALYALELNPGFFREHYEDLGLIIRANGNSPNPNDYNAGNLYKQLKKRGITPSEESPVLIPLRGLALKEDNESSYGLVHLLTDESQTIQAPELSYLNDGRRFSKADERGIPIFDEHGKRTFYSRQGGLDRFYLVRGLALVSGWDRNLDDSVADGRVAVVENFSSGILDEYLARLSKEREGQIAEIESRYIKARDVLLGKE